MALQKIPEKMIATPTKSWYNERVGKMNRMDAQNTSVSYKKYTGIYILLNIYYTALYIAQFNPELLA